MWVFTHHDFDSCVSSVRWGQSGYRSGECLQVGNERWGLGGDIRLR